MNGNVSIKNLSSKELKNEFDKRWFKFKDMPTHTNYSYYAEAKRELERRGMTVCLSGYESRYESKESQMQPGM